MGQISKFFFALGILVPLVAGGAGVVFLASDDGTGQGHFAGLFTLLVIGIPAVGFGLLMLLIGAVTGGIAAARAPAPAGAPASPPPTADRPRQNSVAPSPTGHSGWPAPSWIILVPALLWSAPLGFITFVCYVTGDTEEAFRYACYWIAPIAVAYGLQVAFTRPAA